MRSIGLWILGATVGTAMAQPVVPAGFVARQIAPLLDGQVAQLEALQGQAYGNGVIAATLSNDILQFRRIDASGQITSLASIYRSDIRFIGRIRYDAGGVIDSALHATVSSEQPSRTLYYTIEPSGQVIERFQEGGSGNRTTFDFDFVSGVAGNPVGVLLLDSTNTDGTRFGTMSVDYQYETLSSNSVPSGRTDTDVKGFATDPTGLYGGGVLLADSDDNDGITAIYELRDAQTDETYRLISGPASLSAKFYGDLDIAASGSFGGMIYITEQVSDEIQQVAPDGTHTTWATGFAGIDSLSISPDGESMYVADLNGVWLIRPEGNEPGPALVAHDPSSSGSTVLAGGPVTSARLIFSEPVSFTDDDVTISDADGNSIAFDASGSGSQFMIIGFAEPLEADTYTITVADTLTAVATGQPLDGDNDGVAGGAAEVVLTHRCDADLAAPAGLLDLSDINRFIEAFTGGCE